jgi:protease I
MPNLNNKKILFILPYEDYSDRELDIPRNLFGMFGAEIIIASSSLGTATGRDGGSVETDCLLSDIKPEDYDAVVFVGGVGSVALQNNEDAHRIARGTLSNGKVLGAICIAPVILAKAGVLSGLQATVWSDNGNSGPIEELVRAKAEYIGEEVVVDGRLVTANGPAAAENFARAIIKLLSK